MTKDILPNLPIENIDSIIDSPGVIKRTNIELKQRSCNSQFRSRFKTRSTSSNSQNINPCPDESDEMDSSMEYNGENNNNLSDVGSTCSNSSSPQFSLGSYVMASWKNNYEYLAEVLGHRKRGENIEYKLKYIWDKVVEWAPINKMREAADFEIDFVLNLCKQKNSLETEKSKAIPVVHKKEEDLQVVGGKQKKVKKVENNFSTDDLSIGGNDMVYDKSVAQFHEACKRRRILKRGCPDDVVLNRSLPVEMESMHERSEVESEPTSAKKAKQKYMNKSLDVIDNTTSFGTASKPGIHVNSSNTIASKPLIKNFQCPYCPRQLRQEKLLRAHIQNYHENYESHEMKPSCPSNSINMNGSYCQKQGLNNRSIDNSFNAKLVELKGYVNCASCRQSFVSLKLDPSLFLQCYICLTWSHRKCIGLNSNLNYPYEKYQSFKYNSKWSCSQCTEVIKTNSQLFKYDWICYNLTNSDRGTVPDTSMNHLGSICQNGIPLTPPSTPPISYDPGSLALPNSLDVLRNGKSVLSTYRKKVLSDSASLLNFGHTIYRLFPAISKGLCELKHFARSPTKTDNYASENFLDCAPSQQQHSSHLEDENNIGWMDLRVFENMADDVLSTNGNSNGNQAINSKLIPSSQSTTDHSGGLFSLELVPSEVLKDLLHSDSTIPEDINELFSSAGSNVNISDNDYTNFLNLTPNKNYPSSSCSSTKFSAIQIDENSIPIRSYPEQSPNTIASMLKSSINQDNCLLSPFKSKSDNNYNNRISQQPSTSGNNQNIISAPLVTEPFVCPESMAFYNSVFERLTSDEDANNLNQVLVDIEDATNCLVSNIATTSALIGQAKNSTLNPNSGIEASTVPTPNDRVIIDNHQIQKDLDHLRNFQINPLEKLLDKFEESLKKMSKHVDNLEIAYREDIIQQRISMSNDNMYSKPVSDVMSYSSRIEDYSKMDCFQSSSDEETDYSFLNGYQSIHQNQNGNQNPSRNLSLFAHKNDSTSLLPTLNISSPESLTLLHHFLYLYPLRKSLKSPDTNEGVRRSKLKLFSRLYSLQMAKRDTLYNKTFGFNQVHISPASSLTNNSSSVLKTQNRNPGNLKKMESPHHNVSSSLSRNRCLSSISPLVSANINNQNHHPNSTNGIVGGNPGSLMVRNSSTTFQPGGGQTSFIKRGFPNNSYQYPNYRRNVV